VLSSAKPVELSCGPEPMVCAAATVRSPIDRESPTEVGPQEERSDKPSDPSDAKILAFEPKKKGAVHG
jgi:hypothetical protein